MKLTAIHIVAALFLFGAPPAHAQAQDPAQNNEQHIDKLFAIYSGKSPGCAVGVAQKGKAVFAKGYGMADLEHDVPISAESPFYMASVSKQFAAMAVLLLAEDGKIRLTDSIRKTVPELPEYANSITLYHLLTHTSGVRDYLSLGYLAGLPQDSVVTDRSALRLISRQTALNFEPGTDYLYSNSGYVLLSMVVKNVTHKDLNEFAQERIFRPLGMETTRFQHDHSSLIPGKAFGYEQRQGGWHTSNSMLDVVGDGGLYSSVSDMLRWVANFDNQKIGAAALKTMRTPAKLSNGTEINYGMGLIPSQYRGLPIVEHGGGLGGYRTEVLWFPARQLSVVCLCNAGTANPGELARKVAAVYLSSEMKAPDGPGQRGKTGTVLSVDEGRAKAGLYRNEEQGYIEIVDREGKLYTRGSPGELVALDNRRFIAITAPEGWELEFDEQSPASSLELRQPGQSPARFSRVAPVELSENDLHAYTGEFESRELGVVYRIVADAQGLSVEVGDRPAQKLLSSGSERMRSESGSPELVFQRDSSGKVDGFFLNAGRVRKIRFQRL